MIIGYLDPLGYPQGLMSKRTVGVKGSGPRLFYRLGQA